MTEIRPMTIDEQKLFTDQGRCPHCSKKVDFEWEWLMEETSYRAECPDCGKAFWEVYEIALYEMELMDEV